MRILLSFVLRQNCGAPGELRVNTFFIVKVLNSYVIPLKFPKKTQTRLGCFADI